MNQQQQQQPSSYQPTNGNCFDNQSMVQDETQT